MVRAMKITDVDFAAFDTETTGLDVKADRIVEFGTALFSQGGLTARGSSGFNPGIPIPDEARKVHGISDEKIANRPPFGSLIPRLREKFDSTPLLVGFNCRHFDVPVINAECARAGSDWRVPESKILDVKTLVDWHHRGERKRTQEAMAIIYELKAENLHTAAVDAHLTGQLLLAMVDRGLIPDDVDQARAQEREWLKTVDDEFRRWSYWVYRDRQTRRLRMGAGGQCGRYLNEIGGKLSWYLNNIDSLTEDARRVFEDARDGRLQNELQESMTGDVETRASDEVKWGGW